jgi:hypothetical protein
MNIHSDPGIDSTFPCYGGLFREEAIMLLRRFYVQENEKGECSCMGILTRVLIVYALRVASPGSQTQEEPRTQDGNSPRDRHTRHLRSDQRGCRNGRESCGSQSQSRRQDCGSFGARNGPRNKPAPDCEYFRQHGQQHARNNPTCHSATIETTVAGNFDLLPGRAEGLGGLPFDCDYLDRETASCLATSPKSLGRDDTLSPGDSTRCGRLIIIV